MEVKENLIMELLSYFTFGNIAWGIIFLSFIAACAFFSFRYGIRYGVAMVLEDLQERGIIKIEKE